MKNKSQFKYPKRNCLHPKCRHMNYYVNPVCKKHIKWFWVKRLHLSQSNSIYGKFGERDFNPRITKEQYEKFFCDLAVFGRAEVKI